MPKKEHNQKRQTVRLRPKPNVGYADRLIRVLVAEFFLILAYFWLPIWPAVVISVAAAVLLVTAVYGYCHFYRLIGVDTAQAHRPMPWWQLAPILLAIALLPAVSGSVSARHTGQRFLRDFNALHDSYKQVRLDVEAGKQVPALLSYQVWLAETERFTDHYRDYRPFIIKRDQRFAADLAAIGRVCRTVGPLLEGNDLAGSQSELESLQPVWSGVLARNRVSGAQASVVAAADLMIKLARAGQRLDAPYVLSGYPMADLRLRDIESYWAGQAAVTELRAALEELKTAAQVGEFDRLLSAGQQLEESFNRLYLNGS